MRWKLNDNELRMMRWCTVHFFGVYLHPTKKLLLSFLKSSTKFAFFGSIGKTRWQPWPLIGWDILTSFLKPLNGIQRNLIRSKISTSSNNFVFFGPIGKQCDRPGIWLAETFPTSSRKPQNGIQWNMTGNKISMYSTKFVVNRKNKMVALASD